MAKGKMALKAKNAAHKMLKTMRKSGKRIAKIWVSKGKDGKLKPHVRNIAITAALMAAAAGGAYYIKKHKTHGRVLVKKQKK